MKMFNNYKKSYVSLFIIFALSLGICTGCKNSVDNVKSEVADSKGEYTIYYPGDGIDKIYSYVYKSDATDTTQLIRELFSELEKGDYDGNKEPVISSEMGDVSHNLDSKGLVTVYFSSAYQSLEGIYEVLTRACIVKTLCQLDKVNCVQFYVNDEPLKISEGKVIIDSLTAEDEKGTDEKNVQADVGEVVGIMSDYDFINNIGSEDNSVSKDVYTLYYASKDGKKLETSYVQIEYDASISMEELVMIQLIRGPVSDECYQSVNADTKINKIANKDNICYLDLSSEFLSFPEDVTEDVSVYSVVDSLLELPTVSKVQISVDGKVFTDYSEDGFLERNFKLIDTKGEK